MLQASGRTKIASPAAQLTHDEPFNMGLLALDVLRIHPIVTNQRGSHRNDLAFVGRIGQDLLVARHAGVEDNFAKSLPLCAEGLAAEYRSVLECEFRWSHVLRF